MQTTTGTPPTIPQRQITIVMPALNEEAALATHIATLQRHPALRALGDIPIIVVDNGSTDNTAAVARAAGATVVAEPRRGYGYACLTGARAATTDIILLMDADGSDDPADAARVVARVLHGHADLAMGSRARGQVEPGALTPQQRVGNAVGSILLRLLYHLRVTDLGPLRAIRRDALLHLDMREMGYGWSTEMLAKAARAGLRVHEEPVAYRKRIAGQSKVGGTLTGSIKASIHILRTLSRYTTWSPTPQPPITPLATSPRRRALFIVARLPLIGHTKTRLGAALGHDHATALYTAFLQDLGARFTHAAHRDSYDLYWFYAAPAETDAATFAQYVPPNAALIRQEGRDLGERLAHGFHTLAKRGYERIVVISSDSPHLPAAWISDAFAKLETDDVVIGPAQDGGYYLLGLRATNDLPDLFTAIEMSTPTVYAQTIARANALHLSVAHTPLSFDIDEPADLQQLLDTLSPAPSCDADPAPATMRALQHIDLPAPKSAERVTGGLQ